MQTKFLCVLGLSFGFSALRAEQCTKAIRYGDFESFTVRELTESKLLGGNQKLSYVIGPTDTLRGNEPYPYGVHTQWGSSNAYANVMGVVKISNTMYPEKRGSGHCVRMDVKLEEVRVLGIDISVVVSGSIFLGKTQEPIRSTKDPYGNIDMGIPFTQKPTALMFDYKTRISDKCTIMKSNGFKVKEYSGHDAAMAFVFLQKRWEDENGKVYAKRIGTAFQLFDKTQSSWQNAYQMPIHYGDISDEPYYNKSYMGLMPDASVPYCCENSNGKIVEIQEVGWGTADDMPTHVIVMFSSSIQPAFWGALGNAFWVDNVKFVY